MEVGLWSWTLKFIPEGSSQCERLGSHRRLKLKVTEGE